MKNKSPIIWKNDIPTSVLYDDIYFSKENGLEETRHVFLQGNNLSKRWEILRGNFHIMETGFGTGLNFFAAWQLWNQKNPEGTLHYTSIEKHQLSLDDIQKAISMWSEFDGYLEEFSKQYANSTLILDGGRVILKLLWGDVNHIIPTCNVPVDAWFLDGFSPDKNPDMWSDVLYKNMARLSVLSGSFSTFTASGNVRRGLQGNGFKVSKIAGFGKKRHILTGIMENPISAPAISL